jgi:hypothetical protein
MANYYRDFVPKFSELAEPIHELIRNGTSFTWNGTRQKAFVAIKQAIANSCTLDFSDWNRPFTIELDCSKVAACGVLMQEGGHGKMNVLSYHSSTLDKTQRKYSARELECWAAISACRKFNVYIKGAPKLILISDHEPLQWLRKQKDPRGKFSRWILELEQYDYQFKHKPGRDNAGPDALSRIETSKDNSDLEGEDVFENHIYKVEMVNVADVDEWKELLRREQSRDSTIEVAKQQLTNIEQIKRGRFKRFGQMFLQDDLVVKSGRILVPNSLKYQITRDFHEQDHWGTENTYKNIAAKYYWPNMKQYVKEYVDSCENCMKNKHANTKPKAYLKPNNWAEHFPRQAIALDLATMVRSRDGYKYVLLITDGMSKFVELCPLRDITANSVVKQIEREWIARHGAPETLLTDQGQQVDGNEVRQLCDKYGIRKKRSSPYHPEGDGVSERQIGVMKGLFLTKLTSEKLPTTRWPELLPSVQLSMNNKVHTATRHTPFELMYGENPKHTATLNLRLGTQRYPDCTQAVLMEEMGAKKEFQIEKAQEHLQEAAASMKKQYDVRAHQHDIMVGDHVFVKKNHVKRGESRKLSPLYDNLSEVMEVDMPLILIKSLSSGRVQWRHHNQLKKRTTRTTTDKGTVKVRFTTPPTAALNDHPTDNDVTLGDDTSLDDIIENNNNPTVNDTNTNGGDGGERIVGGGLSDIVESNDENVLNNVSEEGNAGSTNIMPECPQSPVQTPPISGSVTEGASPVAAPPRRSTRLRGEPQRYDEYSRPST